MPPQAEPTEPELDETYARQGIETINFELVGKVTEMRLTPDRALKQIFRITSDAGDKMRLTPDRALKPVDTERLWIRYRIDETYARQGIETV